MAIQFDIVRQGRDFFCQADNNPKFFVGRRVGYQGNVGLYNIFGGSLLQKLNFDPANYQSEFGFWAEFIDPTAECEGRNFLTVNSYDRAAFTFGFGQFAAHVPGGDFVKYFRVMLQRPEAAAYFPELRVRNGRIERFDGPAPAPLETSQSTAALMKYLNPTLSAVEDEEVLAAARLIHWTSNHRPARLAQIAEMIDTYKGFMRQADSRGLIEGRPAAQCCVIADILHHGRGGSTAWTKIANAANSSQPFDNLIAIGASTWAGRKQTLKAKILSNPKLAARKWSRAAGDFV